MRAVKTRTIIAIFLLAFAPVVQTLAIGILNSLLASFLAYTLLVCFGSTMLVGFILMRNPDNRSFTVSLGLKPVRKDLVFAGVAIGIIIDIVMVLGFWVFFEAFSDARAVVAVAEKIGIRAGVSLWIGIAGLVINSIAEELFWRGCPHALLGLQPDEKRTKLLGNLQPGALFRILLVSVFFGVNHIGIMMTIAPSVPAALLSLLGIFLSGVLWSYLREATGSLLPSLVSHVLVTLGYSGLLVFYFSRV